MKNKPKVPKFKTASRERAFWSRVDLSKYFEPKDFERVTLPNLKPTSTSISLRIPNYILFRLKERANALNIPYQTLMKGYISKGVMGRSERGND
jgi:predicted DNA binding CopG/RHH family protein